MILLIIIQFITFVHTQYVTSSSEREELDLLFHLVKDQTCAVRVVSDKFEPGSTSVRMIENLQESMIPASISNSLQNIKSKIYCQLNVVIAPSKQFVDNLKFDGNIDQDYIFLVDNEKQAEHILQSPAKDIKNVVVLSVGFNKKFRIFMSGIFEKKIITKTEGTTDGDSSKLNLILILTLHTRLLSCLMASGARLMTMEPGLG